MNFQRNALKNLHQLCVWQPFCPTVNWPAIEQYTFYKTEYLKVKANKLIYFADKPFSLSSNDCTVSVKCLLVKLTYRKRTHNVAPKITKIRSWLFILGLQVLNRIGAADRSHGQLCFWLFRAQCRVKNVCVFSASNRNDRLLCACGFTTWSSWPAVFSKLLDR